MKHILEGISHHIPLPCLISWDLPCLFSSNSIWFPKNRHVWSHPSSGFSDPFFWEPLGSARLQMDATGGTAFPPAQKPIFWCCWYGYESKPWYPDGTLSWFMDVYSPSIIGFDPSPYGQSVACQFVAQTKFRCRPENDNADDVLFITTFIHQTSTEKN